MAMDLTSRSSLSRCATQVIANALEGGQNSRPNRTDKTKMPDIHHSININATSEVVASMVATADGLRQWWAEDVDSEPDGTVTLGFFNRATIYRLRLVESGAGHVAWRCETGREWQGTNLVFALQMQDSGLLLDFVHANWREATPYFTSCNTTWGGLMFRLKNAAEGRHQGPLFRKNSLAY